MQAISFSLWNLARLNQHNHVECHLGLPLGTLALESVRNRASDVETLARLPLHAALSRRQLVVVNNVVSNDVLLDDVLVLLDSGLVSLARGHEDQRAIVVLDDVVALNDASI